MKRIITILVLLASPCMAYWQISQGVPSVFSADGTQEWRLWAGNEKAETLFNDSVGILFDDSFSTIVIGNWTPGNLLNSVTTVGYGAGLDNTESGQTAIGNSAGQGNQSEEQVVLGVRTGIFNAGSSQTALGYWAGLYNTGVNQTAVGRRAARYNDSATITAIGASSFDSFDLDGGAAKEIASVDFANNQVTITAGGGHGFGVNGTYLNLSFTTTGTRPAGLGVDPDQWKIINSTVIECISVTFTDAGTGTHTVTPQLLYDNSTAVGYDAEPDASNQVVLGDTNVTSIKTTGAFESPLKVTNSSGTDAAIIMDGTGSSPGTITYESDNDTFLFGAKSLTVDTDVLVVDAVGDTVNGVVFFGAGTGNFAFGDSGTLSSIEAGATYNLAMGFDAGKDLTTGDNNFLLGRLAGANLIGGSNNIIMGSTAGLTLTTGTGNFLLGTSSGGNLNTSNSVAIGFNSLNGSSGGTGQNVSIGGESMVGSGAVTDTSSRNVVVGYKAGFLTDSNNDCIFLGHRAGYNQTTNDNLLIIDNQQRPNVAGEVVYPILYGVMNAFNTDDPSLQSLRVNAELILAESGTAGDFVTFATDGDGSLTISTTDSDGAAGDIDIAADGKVVIGVPDTTDIVIESDADTYWRGDGTGLPYASVWGNEIAWTQANAVQNTWYEISDADITTGQLNEVTHDGNGQFTVGIAGRYHCSWSVTSEVTAANQHIQVTFSVNGTETNDGMSHYESFGVSRQFPVSSIAILDLAATDTVEVSIRTTDAGTPDISVDHLNITLTHVGGT